MRDRIITVGIGVFMALGSVGGLERGTIDFGQACVTGLMGAALVVLSVRKWK